MKRPLLLAFVCPVVAFAAIDGTVVNGTTGKPQPGVTITLVKPGQGGMRTLGTATSDATGHFAFSTDEPGGGPQLLQANYAGVNYNKLLTPNIPRSNVELDVFESTKSAAMARIAQRMLLVEPTSGQIAVNETVIVQNDSKQTYNDPSKGGFEFYLPPAANGQVRVNAQGPQGMPLPRAAEKTRQTDIFKVDFPIKPGETQFQVTYVLPAGSPFTFHGEVVAVPGMPAGPLRLVSPPGVTLSGKDIQQLGTEPNTQAAIYSVKANGPFTFDIAGIGSLRGTQAEPADASDSPQVTEGRPPLYAHMGWLLGLAFAILAVGLAVLFRTSPEEASRT
ncbi:MAG: carboxypeptidase regulatory-like domain-containing protein [Acidobacteriaceae bacterium]|nr:carboxypeptidase regulatory-like domain-containing protein [Acidobacteriaceae bacterium]